MKTILNDAKKLRDELITNRRTLHSFAEIEFDLPETIFWVKRQLESYGIEPEIIGKAGITFTLGKGEHTFLLRADMDALPMKETTGLPFAATNGNSHSCGHDMHTAMLLGAARLLKEREDKLKGQVKFMFQPAEEILAGANDMIAAGLLENPTVDAALALHITVGMDNSKSGVLYHRAKELTLSGDALTITVTGKDAHGSTPYLGVDAVQIASHIVLALSALSQNSTPSDVPAVVVVGKIDGGTAPNTVAGKVTMKVSARSKSREYRDVLMEKIKDTCQGIASALGGVAEVHRDYGMPPLYNDDDVDAKVAMYATELLGAENVQPLTFFNGTEDFSMITERVPATLMLLGVGSLGEGYPYYMHNASLKVDENALPVGTAIYAYAAMRWLEDAENNI